MISAPRLTFALAKEKSFPAWFGQLHSRHATPAHSILFFAALSLLLSIVGSFLWLAAMSALVRVLDLYRLHRRNAQASPASQRARSTGLYPPWRLDHPLLALIASGLLADPAQPAIPGRHRPGRCRRQPDLRGNAI